MSYRNRRGGGRKYSFMSYNSDAYEDQKPKFTHTFYWDAPSSLSVRVNHYGPRIMLHWNKPNNRYLPMYDTEFYDLLEKAEEIKDKMKECRSVIRPLYKNYVDEDDSSFSNVGPSAKSLKMQAKTKKKRVRRDKERYLQDSDSGTGSDVESEVCKK